MNENIEKTGMLSNYWLGQKVILLSDNIKRLDTGKVVEFANTFLGPGLKIETKYDKFIIFNFSDVIPLFTCPN